MMDPFLFSHKSRQIDNLNRSNCPFACSHPSFLNDRPIITRLHCSPNYPCDIPNYHHYRHTSPVGISRGIRAMSELSHGHYGGRQIGYGPRGMEIEISGCQIEMEQSSY